MALAEHTLRTVLGEPPKGLVEPRPMVKLHELDEHALESIVHPWAKNADC